MFETPEIRLLQGFCTLDFGQSKETAMGIFGEPNETQTLKDEVLNNTSLVYHYWDKGYSLFFDANRNNAFCSVEIDNREAILFDTKLFSLREKELIALLKQNGHALTDTEMHEWGEKRLSFDSAGLDCYFEHNRLVSVNCSEAEADSPFFYFPN
jgi:hypothetical protein